MEPERVHRIASKLQLRAPLHAIIAIRAFSQGINAGASNGTLGEATFEKGVIAADGPRAGILWLQDED